MFTTVLRVEHRAAVTNFSVSGFKTGEAALKFGQVYKKKYGNTTMVYPIISLLVVNMETGEPYYG